METSKVDLCENSESISGFCHLYFSACFLHYSVANTVKLWEILK